MPDPTNGILDTFVRADENPLSGGGNWPGNFGSPDGLRILSNQAANVVGAGAATGDRYWTTAFTTDQEAFATTAVLATTTDRGVSVAVRLKDMANDTSHWDGYLAEYFRGTTPAVSDKALSLLHVGGASRAGSLQLSVVTNGTVTDLQSVAVDYVLGGRVWLTAIGTTITAYVDAGSGFEQVAQVTDSTWSTAGRIGMRIRGQEARAIDFGGGSV